MEIVRRGNDINGEDILVEVLRRLSSPKIVCSFKLVSKQWLSIISDPIFVRTYISQNSPRWTFVYEIMPHNGNTNNHLFFSKTVVLDDVYSQVVEPDFCSLSVPYTQQQSLDRKRYKIEGVSNGLVLYSSIGVIRSKYKHSYYICNPVTRSWIALPKSTSQCPPEGAGFITRVENGVLKNYTVVLLGRYKNLLGFEVFYSETGEWKNYNVTFGFRSLDNMFWLRNQAAEVNGVLHWITNKGCIIAYDPHKSPDQVRNIEFPERITPMPFYHGTNPFGCLCAEYKGKLRFFTSYSRTVYGTKLGHFEVWVLDDDHTWSLQYGASDMDIEYDAEFSFTDYLVPLCFHPFDSDIVCLGSKDGLVSYNIKTKRVQGYQKCCRQNRRAELKLMWHRTLLLVIPPWPISLSRFSNAPLAQG